MTEESQTDVLSFRPYRDQDLDTWNTFVRESRNGTFLFYRPYMDYHRDRFHDASLMVYRGQELVALLPANRESKTLYSHGGLTYGGLVVGNKMKSRLMLDIFGGLRTKLLDDGYEKFFYKAIPYIYHRLPAGEELYALFRCRARLVRRDLSSVIPRENRIPMPKRRRRCIRQALEACIIVEESNDVEGFMELLEEVLESEHEVQPTHTAGEMRLLKDRFPEHIRLFVALHKGRICAGTVVYETDRVAHCQYIAASEKGKESGGLDLIVDHLLTEQYPDKAYFDFGISTEQGGSVLNQGLAENKESYGARSVCYDLYEWELSYPII